MSAPWPRRRWVALLLALVALFYWRLLGDRFTFLDSPDLAGQVLPWYAVEARAFNDGVYPMWDPYVWSGQPLHGQMQPGAAFPLNWPLFAAPLSDEGRIEFRYVHWHWLFMHLLAALFAYALARELGRTAYGALLAGILFSCGGYIAKIFWPQMLNGAVWLPLTLLLFHRAARARGVAAAAWAALCGGSVGLSILSGHHQTPFFALLALGGLFLYLLWERSRPETAGRPAALIGLFALVAGVSFLVAGLQLLPALEYGSDAYRWVDEPEPVGPDDDVPYQVHVRNRLYVITLLGLVVPQLSYQANTYVGWSCLLLALYAVARCWRERWVRVYSLMALGGIVFAVGPFSLLHGWVYAFVPMADNARSAAHAVFIAQLALALLAARGADRLFGEFRDEAEADAPLFKTAARILVGFALVTVFVVYEKTPDGKFEADPGDHMIWAAVLALILAALLHARLHGLLTPRAIKVALIALVMSELYSTQWFEIGDRTAVARRQYLGLYDEYSRVASFLHHRAERERFRFEIKTGDTFNLGAWNGLEQADGFLASVSRDLYDLNGDVGWESARLLLNTRYTIAREKQREAQIEVFSDDAAGLKVFENPDAYPRAWIEHSTAHITTAEKEKAGVPTVSTCEGEEYAETGRWTIHRSLTRVKLACPGYLVLADPFLPGWRADVDGEPLEIHRYRNALRAVRLPAGEHVVQFLYRPRSVIVGGALTASGLLVCLVAAVAARRRE